MIVYIYIFCILLGIIALIPKVQKDRYHFVGILMFALIWYVMINCNDQLVDLVNYSKTYAKISAGYIEFSYADFGYYIIQRIAVYLGLDFIQFRMCLFAICFFLIYKVVIRYTNNVGMFVLFYALFYSVMDAEQLRNFVAFSIIISGLPYLLEEENKGWIKYLICNIVAIQFHFMTIAYLALLLLKMKENIRQVLIRLIPIYLIVMFFVARHGGVIQNILSSMSELGNERVVYKMSNYSVTSSRWGFLLPCGLYVIECILMVILNAKGDNSPFLMRYNKFEKPFLIVTYEKETDFSMTYQNFLAIAMVGCLYIPFCMINLTFYRVLRNLTMFYIIYMSSKYDSEKNKNLKIIIIIAMFFLTIGWQIWDFTIYQDWNIMKLYYFHLS